MKLLYTSPVLEHPAAGGPQLRVENSIKTLARLGELHLVSRAPSTASGGDTAERYYRSLTASFATAPSVAGLADSRWLRFVQRRLRRALDPDRDARFLVAHAARIGAGAVWFGYGNVSYPLIRAVKALRPGLKVVCDTDSVWSRFVLRELPFETNAARRNAIEQRGRDKEREERAWVALCEVTTAVSDVDAQYYRSIAADPARIAVFPNGIDLATYTVPPPPAADLAHPCLYLAGSFCHERDPMTRAARWVIAEVLPRIRAALPAARLIVVGSGSNRLLADVRDPAVRVIGKVPSVLPYLCHADVALVPLQFESGTRFKILEAAACGTPLVSTSLGAEGLPVAHGTHLLLADDTESFARAVITLLEYPPRAQRLAAAARALVRERYGLDALESAARSVLTRLSDSA